MSVTTISNVLLSGSLNEPERAKLLKWCEIAAASGGSFAIETHYTSNWFIRYTINWPDERPESEQGEAP